MDRRRVHGKWPNCKQNLELLMLTLDKLDLDGSPLPHFQIRGFLKKYMV